MQVTLMQDEAFPVDRDTLPNTLSVWRLPPGGAGAFSALWNKIAPMLKKEGITLWVDGVSVYMTPRDNPHRMSYGYSYATPARGIKDAIHSVAELQNGFLRNALVRFARVNGSKDVALRAVKIREEGQEHLEILRKLSTPPLISLTNNHVLPLLQEYWFEDIVIASFPMVGVDMPEAFEIEWRKSSVGDLVDLLLQALEALQFIHEQGIAHRDAFDTNFLLDWLPESLLGPIETLPAGKPRLYLIDFEFAITFPVDQPHEKCLTTGIPMGGSCMDPEEYTRPMPPGLAEGGSHNAYHLDLWQLGTRYTPLKTPIPELDAIVNNIARHPTAKEALRELRSYVDKTPPLELRVPPIATEPSDDDDDDDDSDDRGYLPIWNGQEMGALSWVLPPKDTPQ